MGAGCSSLSNSTALTHSFISSTIGSRLQSQSQSQSQSSPSSIGIVLHKSNPRFFLNHTHFQKPITMTTQFPSSAAVLAVNCAPVDEFIKTHDDMMFDDPHSINPVLLHKLVYDALVWSSLHGLVVGDRTLQRSGSVPGVGMVHAPIALLPMPFPETHYRQACKLAPIFNELVDRVSLDGQFLQQSLSRTKKVDAFTSRLLDIHSKMLEIGKKEEIRLGLHRSDYMLDEQTKLLLQIELNTISSSFPGLSGLVSELHRSLLSQYREHLGFNPEKIPKNTAVTQFAEALAKAWTEYNNPRAVVMVVVQTEERNMYDQHWLCTVLKERHNVPTIRKTLAEVDAQGNLLSDGTLMVDGEAVAVIYFRAGYAPTDYPSELILLNVKFDMLITKYNNTGTIRIAFHQFYVQHRADEKDFTSNVIQSPSAYQTVAKFMEWKARLLMETSAAIKCPSISYHLTGTKKIQQELAKPNVLERFLEDKDDIAKLRKSFAGLWSLDDADTVKNAIERPGLFVMKPQREGGGNNIYGDDVKEALLRLQKEGSEEEAAYILMQRIFPTISPTILLREGICLKDRAISELGIYSAYLRNKEKVLMNDQCGYLMRTKVSSSNEGGVAAGFAVLDSLYLT